MSTQKPGCLYRYHHVSGLQGDFMLPPDEGTRFFDILTKRGAENMVLNVGDLLCRPKDIVWIAASQIHAEGDTPPHVQFVFDDHEGSLLRANPEGLFGELQKMRIFGEGFWVFRDLLAINTGILSYCKVVHASGR